MLWAVSAVLKLYGQYYYFSSVQFCNFFRTRQTNFTSISTVVSSTQSSQICADWLTWTGWKLLRNPNRPVCRSKGTQVQLNWWLFQLCDGSLYGMSKNDSQRTTVNCSYTGLGLGLRFRVRFRYIRNPIYQTVQNILWAVSARDWNSRSGMCANSGITESGIKAVDCSWSSWSLQSCRHARCVWSEWTKVLTGFWRSYAIIPFTATACLNGEIPGVFAFFYSFGFKIIFWVLKDFFKWINAARF